jgi:hypothetical protein
VLTLADRPGVLLLSLVASVLVMACGRANDRPASGAIPGSRPAATAPGLPPTLTPSEALRFKPLPTPSPGLPTLPSPSVVGSPSAVAAPPIVRTIAPTANGQVASGPVNMSAVLVGRGADLASASLSLNGADTSAQIDKRSAREWTIHASQPLPNGTHTVKVLVRDGSGATGGFTWQFQVGQNEGAAGQGPDGAGATATSTAPAAPSPKPRSP